jgi:transcriptional regulator with XRE-family HTH domain/tetratricopeptide (TPR) repeat protein
VTADPPALDPRLIVTRQDFGQQLTLARENAGLTVRQLAREAGIPASTVGGYLSGRHLPERNPPDLLDRILRACGITDEETVALWRQAYSRVRRSGQDGDAAGQAEPKAPLRVAAGVELIPVSTVPPFGRLDGTPAVRGRQELLGRLDKAISQPGEIRVHVLHGLGGCGKSAVALAAARNAAAAGLRCWWLTAHDNVTLAAGMTAIAVELGASPDELRLGGTPDIAWRLLGTLGEPWLLVLDDADDPPGILALPGRTVTDGTSWLRLPCSRHGAIVVTTRDSSSQTWGDPSPTWLRLYAVPTLSPADGADVLIELAGDAAGDRSAAVALATRLSGLPLALVLAGRYLSEVSELPARWISAVLPSGFTGYLTALDRGRENLSSPGEPTLDSLSQTWDLSLNLLARRGLDNAGALLRLLSCLGPAPVPYELLLRAAVLSSSELFTAMSPAQLWRTLRGLADVGLVELPAGSEQVRVLTLHPVVRQATRRSPHIHRNAAVYLELTIAQLSRVVARRDPKQPRDWARWRLLADHCGAPLDLSAELGIEAPLAAIRLAAQAAGFLRAAGHFAQAEAGYKQVLSAAAHRLPADDPALLAVQHDQARLWYDQGRLRDAELLLRNVVEQRSTVLGNDHPDTLTSRHYLARVLRDRGQLAEAEALLAATLAARTSVLGAAHPDTQTSRNGMADLLRLRGELANAREIYQDVLWLRGKILGERHPATLTTRHYLAEVRHHFGDPGAEAELRALLSVNREVRGADHPRTLAVVGTLAELLHDVGRLTEAEQLSRELVQNQSRVLGVAHPQTLAGKHRLGLILLDRARTAEAMELLTSVLTDRQEMLGPDHPLTVLSRETIEAVRHRTD